MSKEAQQPREVQVSHKPQGQHKPQGKPKETRWLAQTALGSTRSKQQTPGTYPRLNLRSPGTGRHRQRLAGYGSGFRVTNIRTYCTLRNACPGRGSILLGALTAKPQEEC